MVLGELVRRLGFCSQTQLLRNAQVLLLLFQRLFRGRLLLFHDKLLLPHGVSDQRGLWLLGEWRL